MRDVAELRTGDGRELPCLLRIELERLRRRLVLALELIHEVEAERAEALAATTDDKMTQKIAALQRLSGIGPNFAAVLVREVLYRALVQIANTSRPSLRRCAEFRPKAPRSTLQGQLDLGRVDVAVQTVPSGCDASARCRRS